MIDLVLDVMGLLCLLLGGVLSLLAAIGMVRFDDLLSRLHSATKPQVLGVLMTVLGVGLTLRTPGVIGMLLLVAVFQMLTAPVSSHMVSRAAVRTGQVDLDRLRHDPAQDWPPPPPSPDDR